MSNVQKKHENNRTVKVADLSSLDTKESLLHFSKIQQGESQQKKAFNLTKGRRINLFLADKLEGHRLSKEIEITKQIRYLRFCSKIAVLQSNLNNDILVGKVSQRCRSSQCSICRKLRSGKFVGRLKSALEDEENKDLFKGVKFYMLTLTLKHNDKVRNNNYLKEFKNYSAKLRRSKLYKNLFSGAVSSIENVIGEKSYHIHSHSIVSSSSIVRPIKEVQLDISAKWLKLTKDSSIVHLALIKSDNLIGAIVEVLKYSTKLSDIKKFTGKKLDMYVDWILQTKGQNFVNCSGIFRGLGITGQDSKYDSIIDHSMDFNTENFGVRTAKLTFNYSTMKSIKKVDKEKFHKTIHLKSIDKSVVIFSLSEQEMKDIESDFRYCNTLDDLREYIEAAKKNGTTATFDIREDSYYEGVPF